MCVGGSGDQHRVNGGICENLLNLPDLCTHLGRHVSRGFGICIGYRNDAAGLRGGHGSGMDAADAPRPDQGNPEHSFPPRIASAISC